MGKTALKKTLVIDLDGTLADTNRDLHAVLNRTIASQGLAPLEMDDVGHVFGIGAKAMIKHAYAFQGQEIDEELLETLFYRFIADYEENLVVETRLFEGAVDALNDLATKGWIFAICTNKFEKLAINIVEKLGQADRFAAICGGDSFDIKKPHGDHILMTIAKAGGNPAKAVMLGDSKTDIDAARASGIPVIAVSFGYSDIPVQTLNPDRVINHYSELPQALIKLGF